MDYQNLVDDVLKLKNEVKKVFIYGAGFYGQDICRALHNNNINIDGFLTTKKTKKKKVLGLPVCLAEDFLNQNIGIVLGLSDIYTEEVMTYLRNQKFNMEYIINGGRYITVSGGREDLRNTKVLEISTVMGCTVNCKFCPQDVLLTEYYRKDKNRKRLMTMDDFNLILQHTPKECIIDFSGMTEPFNNPYCLDMIKLACDEGRKVYLFTTLADVKEEDVNELIKLPIYYMTLHVADKYGFAHISKTDSYYKNVYKVLNAKKKNGMPFVDFVNAQTDPDEKIAEMAKGKYEIMRSVQDRAGNLKDDYTEKRDHIIPAGKKIKCCFCGDDLSNNLVLPDGTLLICNMDFGLKHVLGNLYEEDYDTIRSKGELQRVLKEMDGGNDTELLCRRCLLARIDKIY